MSTRSYIGGLDRLLLPEGFVRDGRFWRRRRDGFEDIVNLQWSVRAGSTVNVKTGDLATLAILKEALEEEVSPYWWLHMVRIGKLMDGTDHWWRGDPKGLCEAVRAHALPYFQRMRSLEEQARNYRRPNPPKLLSAHDAYLAVTLFRMGLRADACDILSGEAPNTLPRVVRAATALRRRFGCEADAP